MKSNLKIFLITLAFGLFISSSVVAQSYPQAQVSADIESVYLPDGPLVEKYELVFANWDFDKAQFVTNHFEKKSDIVSFKLDYPNSKIIVTLDLDSPKSDRWGFEEWKSHLISMQ